MSLPPRPPRPPVCPRRPPPISEAGTSRPDDCDFQPLQWDQYFDKKVMVKVNDDDTFCTYRAGDKGPLVVLMHGGGHTALSWGLVVEIIKPSCRVVAYDCRGHGETECANSTALAADTLTADCVALVTEVQKEFDGGSPDVLVVGHSMGGAIAARVAASNQISNLKGLIVLDVVEGTAMEALPHMKNVISKIPTSFGSLKDAIMWTLKTHAVSNRTSARLSVPSQLIERDGRYYWRLELGKTEDYWTGWFKGLSKAFLSAQCGKLLIVAGQDRMDTELMIAQMQGKFQMKLVAQAGHLIMEDQPAVVASNLLEFVKYYKMK